MSQQKNPGLHIYYEVQVKIASGSRETGTVHFDLCCPHRTTSHVWLLSTGNGTSATKALKFYLFNFN